LGAAAFDVAAFGADDFAAAAGLAATDSVAETAGAFSLALRVRAGGAFSATAGEEGARFDRDFTLITMAPLTGAAGEAASYRPFR
jgi:hypothetical protein